MMEAVILIFVLLVAFQAKHLLVDYGVQLHRKDGMAKFNESGWVWPLFKHAADHGIATVFISGMLFLYFNIDPITAFLWLIALFVFDTTIHFTMDRIKASPHMLGRFKIEDKRFWVALGLDQSVHHLTHYAIIAILLYIVGVI